MDLILDADGTWHIIEVNPRLSGMTYTYASWLGMSVFELLYNTVVEPANTVVECPRSGCIETTAELNKFVMSLKLPLMSESQMKTILQIPGVRLLNQTNDLAAKQEREKGFCECIIAADDKSVLQKAVAIFEEKFPGDAIVLQAKKILK